ncbi:hypothetical protein ILUMI_19330 [Ignelater luminosus]|uniref:Copia protein n=1 Tax=Ignelater luminosus TaxID=2038154 RepID=A0A8K0CKR1_IGNLU|nr:hypothetical protein ILUMI_19330 [Ignelater luminosus]
MTGGEERYYISSFDGNNFNNWKFRLRVLLEKKNCLEWLDGMDSFYNIIDSDDAAAKAVKTKQIQDFLKKDRKCKSIITQSVADRHLEYIKDKHTAKEMWAALQNTFERKGIRNQLLLRKQLLQLKLEERGILNSHFLTFDSICHNCGQERHKRSECRRKEHTDSGKRNANNTVSGKSKNGIGFKPDLGNGNCVTILNWFLDLGATDHMTNSECYFAETWELQQEIKISVAKCGEGITARKARNVRGCLVVNDTKTTNANLSLHEKEDLWHKRYGHIGNESLQKIINFDMVNGIEMLNIKNTEKYETCIYDICGPVTPEACNGYAVKGYRLWNPQTGTIINGRDVIFVENEFMFNDSIHIDESFEEEEREVEVRTDEESGKVESARNTRERRRPT